MENKNEMDIYQAGFENGILNGIKKMHSFFDKNIVDNIGEFFVVFKYKKNLEPKNILLKIDILKLLILICNDFTSFEFVGFFKTEEEARPYALKEIEKFTDLGD